MDSVDRNILKMRDDDVIINSDETAVAWNPGCVKIMTKGRSYDRSNDSTAIKISTLACAKIIYLFYFVF